MRSTGSTADPQRRASTSNTRRSPALPATRKMSRSGPRSVPFTTTGVGAHRLGGLDRVVAIGQASPAAIPLPSPPGNVPSVNSRIFEIPDGVSMRTGYTPGRRVRFQFHQERRRAARRLHHAGLSAGSTGVNAPGSVVVIVRALAEIAADRRSA